MKYKKRKLRLAAKIAAYEATKGLIYNLQQKIKKLTPEQAEGYHKPGSLNH